MGSITIRNRLDTDNVGLNQIVRSMFTGGLSLSGRIPGVAATVGDCAMFRAMLVGSIPIVGRAPIGTVTVVPQLFDFYVSNSGNDAWNGQAPTFTGGNQGPFATFTKAMQSAQLALSGNGRSIGVIGGSYNQRIINPANVPGGTSWANSIRIANYSGQTVTINPTSGTNDVIHLSQGQKFLEFDGIGVNGAFADGHATFFGPDNSPGTIAPTDIRFKNATIQGRTTTSGSVPSCMALRTTRGEITNVRCTGSHAEYGFYVGGTDNIIDGCDIDGTAFGGVHIFSSSAPFPLRITVKNTRIRNIITSFFFGQPDPRTFGILVSGSDHLIYNNVIHDLNLPNEGQGNFSIVFSGSGHRVYYNTMAMSTAVGAIKIDPGAQNGIVRNNLGYNLTGNNAPNSIQDSSGNTTNTKTNNFFSDTVNPMFANLAARDFHLTANTPLSIRGAGISVSGITTDKDGVIRSNPPDIGAYEI